MPQLVAYPINTLCIVNETPDDNGYYDLHDCVYVYRSDEDGDDFDSEIFKTRFCDFAEKRCGIWGGQCFEITDADISDFEDKYVGTGVDEDADESRKIRIEIEDNIYLLIPDIRDRIQILGSATSPDEYRFCVFVNHDFSEYRWGLIEPRETEYRG